MILLFYGSKNAVQRTVEHSSEEKKKKRKKKEKVLFETKTENGSKPITAVIAQQ